MGVLLGAMIKGRAIMGGRKGVDLSSMQGAGEALVMPMPMLVTECMSEMRRGPSMMFGDSWRG